jgi:acetoin utilization deacetylase AcuC-like enzyme
MNPVILFSHPLFRQHDTGPGHPECAARLDAIEQGIDAEKLRDRLTWATAEPVALDHLYRVHATQHVDRMLALEGKRQQIDSDTIVSPATIPAALRSAGAVVQGVDAVLSGDYRYAFSLGRPPGHHATASDAMGFCFFNNVAVGAAYATAHHGLERVLIVDLDVHHGNGTQDIFYHARDVFYFSMHQGGWYPGTGAVRERGEGEGAGYTLNLPLPAGMGDDDYLWGIQELLLPVIEKFRPQLTIISAGFDAHTLDPLADMHVTSAGYARMFQTIFTDLERIHCPVVLALEGGYSLVALRESVPAMLKVCLGERSEPERPLHPQDQAIFAVDRAREAAVDPELGNGGSSPSPKHAPF